MSKVLGPMHIWALGVGIVLVGEFMGWNFTVAKGGSIGAVIALWTVAMLEAADALVVGEILESINPKINPLPFIILSLLVLTYLNYRGVYATLTLNYVITVVPFVTIFILLFSTNFFNPQATLLDLKAMTDGLPFGYLGIIAAMQFAVWFFLGIEGGALAAEECRSTSRYLPVGTMIGLATAVSMMPAGHGLQCREIL